MKPVLQQRVAEFSETSEPDNAPGTGTQSKVHGKRHTNRPGTRKAPTGHEPVSPSTINLNCIGSKDQAGGTADDDEQKAALKSTLCNAELKKLHGLWGTHKQISMSSSQIMILGSGKGGMSGSEPLTVLSVNDLDKSLTDGATEWTAVSWIMPKQSLACVLVCKGVELSELPRLNMADWKAGSFGVPTFHCGRCLRKWLKQGHLPQDCNEPENITEGPAMCITSPDKAKSEIVVVGEDGKPIRIKVEDPKSIKKMLKRKEKKKKRKKREKEARRKAALLQKHNSQVQSNNGDGSRVFSEKDKLNNEACARDLDLDGSLSSSDADSSDDDLFELPKAFKKFIMKKTEQESECGILKSSEDEDDDFSVFDSSGSNLSDLSDLQIGSDADLDELMADFLGPNTSSDNSASKKSKKKHKRRTKGGSKTVPSDKDLFSYSSSCFDTSSSYEISSSADQNSIESFLKSKSELQAKRSKKKCKKTKSLHHKQGGEYGSTDTSSECFPHINSSHKSNLSSDHQGKINSSLSGLAQHLTTSNPSTNTKRLDKRKSHSKEVFKSKTTLPNKSSDFHLPDITGKTATTEHEVTHTVNTDKPLHLPQLSQTKANLVQQGNHASLSVEDSSEKEDTEDQKAAKTNGLFASLISDDGVTSNKPEQQNCLDQLPSNSIAELKTVSNSYNRLPSTTSGMRHIPQKSSAKLTANVRGTDKSSTSTQPQEQKGSQNVSNATVREGISLSHNKQTDQSKHGRLKQKSIATDDIPLLRGASQDRRMPDAGNYIDMQQVKAQSLDEKYAKRIGRKVVKKMKKNPIEQTNSVKHNSKDIGGLIDADGQRIEDRNMNSEDLDSQSAMLFIPSALEDPSTDQLTPKQSYALQQSSQSKQSGSKPKRQSAGPIREKAIPMPLVGKRGDTSRLSKDEETLPLSAGLGSRVPAKVTDKSFTPVKMQTPMYSQDYSQSTTEFTVGKQAQTLSGATTATTSKATQENILQRNENEAALDPMGAEDAVTQPSQNHCELEVITEEEDEDDSDDNYYDFKIAPVYEDKPISILSFTSSYAYSFYPMAAQYKKAYEVTHKRTLQPIRLGRNKAKVRARKG